MSKILVTGAAGFIGSNLAERLAAEGHDVCGLDCFTDYYARALKEANAAAIRERGVQFFNLDLAEGDLAAAVEGVEFVFHLAAQPGISATIPYADYVRNNLLATERLIQALRPSADLRLFNYISTSSVYGQHAYDNEKQAPKPTSYYGVTKLAAEQLSLAYQREEEFPATALRIFSVYGPRERPEKLYPLLIGSILRNEPFPLFEGSEAHSRSFTFIKDILDGFLQVMAQPEKCVGEIYNLGTDVEVTTGEGIAMIEKIMGKTARFAIKPRRPGDQLHTRANIDKARCELGYDPHTTLEEGLRAEVEWYVNEVWRREN